ncbi:hypothetical protein HELRODRAFT_105874 [Helobdella robusta]|uniref:C-mannosyltransferase DPY19L1 n=1 Tax=Helobdella robusta TaxID=6412 RepID=T1EDY1_HELRO|nr:hypothetical protein HELRODRAFT_105874 [Helobdella robusta]ESO05865.1 hypothetical protein HELRODRAFT_105874 [Helobdella robusta]
MFESDRHFSHLSTLERELTFRTEMGLYYSYFKTIAQAPTFISGMKQIMFDTVTEYPLTINTLKRFNLYPEVLLGAMYRIYEWLAKMLKYQTMVCYSVNRGKNLSPVQSCEGLGEKPYFYVEAVFLLNGLNMGLFFLFGWYLSGSYFGGLITVLCFFFNHGECTRVQWTPPLRESFAYPFLVLQMFLVTKTIKSGKTSFKTHSLPIAVATTCFMLPWQFAQFALLMQTLSVYATYLLGLIRSATLQVIIAGQSLGLLVSVLFLFANEMLVTSFFSSSLVSIWIILYTEKYLNKLNLPHLFKSIIQGLSLLAMTFYIKIIISKLLNVTDDEHIGDLFRSKFSNFQNFHTQLYVCAPEFDFMELATPIRLTKTLLLPCSTFITLVIIIKVCLFVCLLSPSSSSHSSNPSSSSSPPDLEQASFVYHTFQLSAYSAMAIIIMRLKLFWTPHLCLMTSLLANQRLLPWLGSRYKHFSIIACIAALMGCQGVVNLRQQWSVQGEFSNIQMEEMIEWINHRTPRDAVFAGPMPTMATVKLCTGRPIVNHPHYEDAGLRNRTRMVYTVFSRKSSELMYRIFTEMKVQYFIVEEQWCLRRSKPGCGMTDIWDMEDRDNLAFEPLCKRLYDDPSPYFVKVFKNNVYDIFRVLDNNKVNKNSNNNNNNNNNNDNDDDDDVKSKVNEVNDGINVVDIDDDVSLDGDDELGGGYGNDAAR